jgi:hemolysin D
MTTPESAAPVPSMGIGHRTRTLLSRYAAVFGAAWSARRELAGPRRLSDEAAFLPAALSLQHTPPHPAPRRLALALCALFAAAMLWACVGEIDIVAVAQGRVVVSQRSKLVQPLETSVVKAIHVRDGERVHAGQLLVELDATVAQADANRVRQERAAAEADSLRSRALLRALTAGGSAAPALATEQQGGLSTDELANAQAQLQSEWQDIAARLARLRAEAARRQAELETARQVIEKLRITLPLARQREADIKGPSEQGFVAGHAGQDRTRERVELERDLATAQARLVETEATLIESRHAEAAYRAETLRTLRDRLVQAELRRQQLGEEAAKAQQRAQLTRLSAPVAGTVQQLAVHTPGGVVTPAQVLLVIVPDDAAVTAEVTLENKDVGFVREGHLASVKLETFPYTRYGTVDASVTTISADAVNDEKRGAIFPATLALKQATLDVDGKTIRLAPGMNLTAEIRTGRRRVIDYLLSPVQQHLGTSLRER